MNQELGILVFGHTRPLYIADVLESLDRQGVIGQVDVWLDGHQGQPETKFKVELVREVVAGYSPRSVRSHNGAIGFRKIMLQALDHAASNYRYIIVLEDDCFPTRDAIETFLECLRAIEDDDSVFSVYGHPFLMPAEGETCTRFQGWGWGSTAEKIKRHIDQLIYLFSITEQAYLEQVSELLTPDIIDRLDVTPPRNPTSTLGRFFAWDETLALLTAVAGQHHMKTPTRTIYNFGASADSSRFKNVQWYRKPPFNMVSHEEVWQYF